jgi:hypothetical protein
MQAAMATAINMAPTSAMHTIKKEFITVIKKKMNSENKASIKKPLAKPD